MALPVQKGNHIAAAVSDSTAKLEKGEAHHAADPPVSEGLFGHVDHGRGFPGGHEVIIVRKNGGGSGV